MSDSWSTDPKPAPASRHPHWAQVRQAFEAALDLPQAGRAAFLDQAVQDPSVRAEVVSLLAHHQDTGGSHFLDAPAALDWPPSPAPPVDRRGQHFGPWEVLRHVGAGGMGEVFEARRADGSFEGRAAVKLLKRGMDSTAVLQRFAQERQALARLNHPHIARLFDAGISQQPGAEGLPYFVMEFVDGEPIDQAARPLDLDQRLQLFLQLADAVAHAHRNLLVHRDLKPGNVLVDRDGRVKLLDFGIAKALDPLDDPDNILTTLGAQRPFTPSYASPEQVRGEPVSTATDIYSLGVLLYQLLTGVRPTGRDASSPAEAARSVLEEQPTRPSSLPADQVEDSRWLATRRRLQGDLDNILLKALEKPVERRYRSVDALAADIRRFLSGHPVSARPPSPGYLLAKFAARHRASVAAAAVALLAILGGLAASRWQALEADQARASAERRLKDIRGISNEVVMRYGDAITHLPGGLKLKEKLLTDTLRFLDRLLPEAEADPQFKGEIAMAYSRLADLQVSNQLNSLDNNRGGDSNAARAIALFEPAEAAGPEDPLFYLWWARALRSRAFVARGDKRAEQALGLLQAARPVLQRGLLRFPDNRNLRSELGSITFLSGQLQDTVELASLGRGEAALQAFSEAQQIYLALDQDPRADDADTATYPFQLGTIEGAQALVHWKRGNLAAAQRHGDAAVRLRARALGMSPDNSSMRSGLANEASNLAAFSLELGDSAAALRASSQAWEQMQALRRADPDNPQWPAMQATYALHHGRALLGQGRPAEALPPLAQAESALLARVGQGQAGPSQQRRLAWVHSSQARALHALGRRAEAMSRARQAHQGLDALLREQPQDREAWLLVGELASHQAGWPGADRRHWQDRARIAYQQAQAQRALAGVHLAHWQRLSPGP